MKILFISVACIVIAYAVSMKHICRYDYKCPECGAEIKPKWYHISAWLHMNDERVIKCPHCGRKGFCRRID